MSEMVNERDGRRGLVELFPRFLMRRRRGWKGLDRLLAERRLSRPAFFLLRAIVEETEPGESMTEAELRRELFNPYSTVETAFDALPELVEAGLLAPEGSGYRVTDEGGALFARAEQEVRAYLSTQALEPADEVAHLAETLSDVAWRMWLAAEPADKAHQARARRLPPIEEGSAALVRLEAAVYALWTARDDAHMAAWRAAGFDGPALDLLSRIWAGEAGNVVELAARLEHSQSPEDVAQGLAVLTAAGYVREEEGTLLLTEPGRATREAIEAETDRVYFAPWPALAAGEVARLRRMLEAVCEQLVP